jgi:hypothetical protein
MNNSSMIAFLDSDNYETFGLQIFLLIVAWLGSFSHIINIVILLSPELKDISYKFMLANSVNNTFYLLLCGIYDFFICKNGCEKIDKPLLLIIYFIVIDEYLTSCMAVFNLLIQIFLSLQRIFLVLNKSYLQNISLIKSILILASISLIFYSPILTIQRIELSHPNATSNAHMPLLYSIVHTHFGETAFGQSVPTVLSSLRIFLATILLSIVNIINFIAFKRYFEKRKKLTKPNSSKNILNIFQ